jgi:hypothetical protein
MELIQRMDYNTNKRQPTAIAFMNELSPEFNRMQDLEFVLQVSQSKVLDFNIHFISILVIYRHTNNCKIKFLVTI